MRRDLAYVFVPMDFKPQVLHLRNNLMAKLLVSFAVIGAFFHSPIHAAPQSFSEAKVQARQHVYYDHNQSEQGTLYCGCKWRWTGKSGGRVDLASCGYTPRRSASRAARTEWEHIVPAWVMGHQRQCWQNGVDPTVVSPAAIFLSFT